MPLKRSRKPRKDRMSELVDRDKIHRDGRSRKCP